MIILQVLLPTGVLIFQEYKDIMNESDMDISWYVFQFFTLGILYLIVSGFVKCLRIYANYRVTENLTEVILEGNEQVPTEIRMIKVLYYKDCEEFKNSSYNVCAICIESYEPTDKVSVLDNCKHMFHEKCIDDWLVKSNTCPLCND